MLEIGSLVDGKYKILNKVGQGGMSVVYLAMNEKANKQWAVKEVRKDGIKDFEVVKQGLVAETDILKKLSHPSLPSIIDVIDTDDSFIIIMDYIQGNSLNKALDEYGAQPQENVIEWAKQLCDVLGYLHTRNPAIIYRDMKPANIMLKPDGNVTLIDFGTAREFKEKNLADTTCLGTVGYAAPEQFGGMGQTDARTDIYCLGATLYHLVTGMNPCEPPYDIYPIRQINPTLSSGLERIIMKCTQRNPDDRYQSAAELMYALEHYGEIDDTYRKKQKKKLGGFLTVAALTVAFAGVAIWGYMGRESARSQNYDYLLANASSKDAYYQAILTDTSRTDAYIGNDEVDGLVEFLVSDGNLDSDESQVLTKLRGGLESKNRHGYDITVNVLEQLKESNPEGYQDVCYTVGEAYLFYYDTILDKDRYKAAAIWLKDAGDRYPAAEMYCDISKCLQNVQRYNDSEQIANFEKGIEELWKQLDDLLAKAEGYDDDMKLRVWRVVVSTINKNYDLISKSEAYSPEDSFILLDRIKVSCNEITSEVLKNSIGQLKKDIENTEVKIHTAESGA